MGISALFRPDPCLRRLEDLEKDSRKSVERMTVRSFAPKNPKRTSYVYTAGCPAYHPGFFPSAPNRPSSTECRARVEPSNMRRWVHPAASPSTGHISRPQTVEAGSTRQPAESSTSRAFSGGQSTTIESMAHTGRLRHSVPTPSPAISTEDARQLKGDYLKGLPDYAMDLTGTSPPPGTRVDVGAAYGTRHAARGTRRRGWRGKSNKPRVGASSVRV